MDTKDLQTEDLYDIVLVDDEDDVLETIGPFLGAQYKIETFKNGDRAIQFIRKNRVKLLITDLRMPGLNGFMLIDEAKMLNKDLKIILISGFIDTNSKEERDLYRKYTPWCLSKPFSLADIGKLVDGILT
jgi:DNA-binding NtrC family response regulator